MIYDLLESHHFKKFDKKRYKKNTRKLNLLNILNFHLFCRSVILPLGYFVTHRLLILRLRRVGYPLHEPSKCKRFSNSLQMINKKTRIAKKNTIA